MKPRNPRHRLRRYGKRLNQTQTFDGPPTNSVTVSATTNRITDPGYGYDANGNMTNDGANTLTYDAESRAVTAAAASYTYDGNSLRVKKVSASTTTVYIFSGTKVIAEYSGTSSPYPLGRVAQTRTREEVLGCPTAPVLRLGILSFSHSLPSQTPRLNPPSREFSTAVPISYQ